MPRKRKKDLAGVQPAASEVKDVTMSNIVVERSYQRQLNMSAHGGLQYETTTFFARRSCHVLSIEDARIASEILYRECVDEVESTIKAFDELMIGSSEEPTKKKKEKKADVEMTNEEIKEIAPFINALVSAATKEELLKVGDDIAQAVSNLKESQVSYLRMKYEAKAKLLK